jgi:hypothetical protein
MGQGTSRLNWACSCEDGKFNLSATYEEQKFSPTETIGKVKYRNRTCHYLLDERASILKIRNLIILFLLGSFELIVST